MIAENTGPSAIVPPADGVESAPSEVGEASLDGRDRESAQLGDLILGQPVRGESQDFHPLLDLRARVVEPVVVDLLALGRRDFETFHGILP